MIAALAGLLVCQLLGEVLVRVLALPFPGPVAGLGLMFVFLVWHGRGHGAAVPVELGRVADALLRNLSLLFIPAAVGVVQYVGLLRQYALPIAIAVIVSTTVTLVVTALTFRLVSRLHTFRHKTLPADVEAAIDPEHHP
jgi:holin-like protein